MLTIQNITTNSRQKQTFTLTDGTQVKMSFYFCPLQFGWFIPNLTYGDFILNGLRISNSPNMLHQFRNQIPFGLACFSTNSREPSQQQDFSSGASVLYILTADEVAEYARLLAGGA